MRSPRDLSHLPPKSERHRLIAVTPGRLADSESFLAAQMLALEPYVDAIQIREKGRTPRAIGTLLDNLKDGGFPFEKLIMNDRADIALAYGIPTLQVTESSLAVEPLQAAFPQLRFGRSLHSIEQIEQEGHAYEYLLLGHLFPTASKETPPFGVAHLPAAASAARRVGSKLIGIGGINQQNITQVLPYVDGVALMSSLFAHDRANRQGIEVAEAIRREIEHFN